MPRSHVAGGVAPALLHAAADPSRALLGDELLAVYLIGSGALGGPAPEQSDIDLAAICANRPQPEIMRRVVDALKELAPTWPVRGLELVLYTRAAVATPSPSPRFELNLNIGRRMPLHVSFDPNAEPTHWSWWIWPSCGSTASRWSAHRLQRWSQRSHRRGCSPRSRTRSLGMPGTSRCCIRPCSTRLAAGATLRRDLVVQGGRRWLGARPGRGPLTGGGGHGGPARRPLPGTGPHAGPAVCDRRAGTCR